MLRPSLAANMAWGRGEAKVRSQDQGEMEPGARSKAETKSFCQGQTAMSKLIRGAVTASVPSGAIQAEGTA